MNSSRSCFIISVCNLNTSSHHVTSHHITSQHITCVLFCFVLSCLALGQYNTSSNELLTKTSIFILATIRIGNVRPFYVLTLYNERWWNERWIEFSSALFFLLKSIFCSYCMIVWLWDNQCVKCQVSRFASRTNRTNSLLTLFWPSYE